MKFTKMQGAGNDYIYVNCFKENIADKSKIAKLISDRHFGIGSDGLICINPSDIADFEMEMYNADGTRSEMCGNGMRCVGKYVYDYGLTDKTSITVASMGVVRQLLLHLKDDQVDNVTVSMGKPELNASKIPVNAEEEQVIAADIEVDGDCYKMTCVSMGNPHAVMFIEDVKKFPLEKVGPLFEKHSCFPNRVNAEFAKVLDRNTIEMRVWERGSGETLACGTGACATAVAAVLNGFTQDKVTVQLLGGNLEIEWDRGSDVVYMTGPAKTVFDGEIKLPDSYC